MLKLEPVWEVVVGLLQGEAVGVDAEQRVPIESGGVVTEGTGGQVVNNNTKSERRAIQKAKLSVGGGRGMKVYGWTTQAGCLVKLLGFVVP